MQLWTSLSLWIWCVSGPDHADIMPYMNHFPQLRFTRIRCSDPVFLWDLVFGYGVSLRSVVRIWCFSEIWWSDPVFLWDPVISYPLYSDLVYLWDLVFGSGVSLRSGVRIRCISEIWCSDLVHDLVSVLVFLWDLVILWDQVSRVRILFSQDLVIGSGVLMSAFEMWCSDLVFLWDPVFRSGVSLRSGVLISALLRFGVSSETWCSDPVFSYPLYSDPVFLWDLVFGSGVFSGIWCSDPVLL
jgi:hypothetical protein